MTASLTEETSKYVDHKFSNLVESVFASIRDVYKFDDLGLEKEKF